MYDNLVIEGTSSKVFAMCGALQVLEENRTLSNIKRFVGTSSGSLLCVMLALGYSVIDAYRKLDTADTGAMMQTSLPVGVLRLHSSLGYYSPRAYTAFLHQIFTSKNFPETLTFEQLYAQRGKVLIITGTCLNKRETHYYHHLSNPSMPIAEALRISTSIPFLFPPVKWKGDTLVDGGISENYPVYVVQPDGTFPDTRTTKIFFRRDLHKGNSATLGLKILEAGEREDMQVFHGNDSVTNLLSYGYSLINTFMTQIDRNNLYPGYEKQTIGIALEETIPLDQITLTPQQKSSLYSAGIKAAQSFF